MAYVYLENYSKYVVTYKIFIIKAQYVKKRKREQWDMVFLLRETVFLSKN